MTGSIYGENKEKEAFLADKEFTGAINGASSGTISVIKDWIFELLDDYIDQVEKVRAYGEG